MDENSVSEPAQRTIEEFESENRPSYQDTLPDTWMVSAGSYDSIADKWARKHELNEEKIIGHPERLTLE